jgi:hypothetical protein
MPYSNRRRHNLPSIPQTLYQTLIIPCPNFDPIYQVIFLKNSNEWNLSLAKKRILKKKREREKKKKREQGLKNKRGETSCEEAPCFKIKKKMMKSKQLGEILLKERKKERRSHFPIVQNPMCGLIHTHTSFAFPLPSIP